MSEGTCRKAFKTWPKKYHDISSIGQYVRKKISLEERDRVMGGHNWQGPVLQADVWLDRRPMSDIHQQFLVVHPRKMWQIVIGWNVKGSSG